ELKSTKKQLDRPLIVLGGYLDPGIGTFLMERTLKQYVEGEIITVTFLDCFSFEACRERVMQMMDERFPNDDPNETVEVDVIGESMGGLIGVYSAMSDPELGKRLRIRNLYTISSPLTGATVAELAPFTLYSLQRDMKPGSEFYAKLAEAEADYQLFSYTRLDDEIVGEQYTSAPGRGVWWVDNPSGERSHVGAMFDPRILLDIILRLRNEKPVTKWPPVELPTN
ncbi:MAG TPA: hypothetical protein PK402_14295, partial [Tepidisphaeraceae bacterium]|nr:hypothetical protein [Tepidisphaeraceae bacterium]